MTPWIIAGPTAVGKSTVALEVAERCGGEIVGADAFQVYRGLEILTAQPTPEERARVPHHLLGDVPVSQAYDVAQYLTAARERIASIQARGRQPIIVGGTGLYLRALTCGLADLPAANATLREELAATPLDVLQAELIRSDPLGAQQMDLKNPRRLIRAIEVCRLTGQPFSSFRREWTGEAASGFRGVVLLRDRAELHGRINARVEWMFDHGVLEEVAALPELAPTAGQVLGGREIREYLAGRLSRAECVERIQRATRQYAKRQLTWFARENWLVPLDASAPDVAAQLHAHLSKVPNLKTREAPVECGA